MQKYGFMQVFTEEDLCFSSPDEMKAHVPYLMENPINGVIFNRYNKCTDSHMRRNKPIYYICTHICKKESCAGELRDCTYKQRMIKSYIN